MRKPEVSFVLTRMSLLNEKSIGLLLKSLKNKNREGIKVSMHMLIKQVKVFKHFSPTVKQYFMMKVYMVHITYYNLFKLF